MRQVPADSLRAAETTLQSFRPECVPGVDSLVDCAFTLRLVCSDSWWRVRCALSSSSLLRCELGLAAFGVVAAQKAAGPTALAGDRVLAVASLAHKRRHSGAPPRQSNRPGAGLRIPARRSGAAAGSRRAVAWPRPRPRSAATSLRRRGAPAARAQPSAGQAAAPPPRQYPRMRQSRRHGPFAHRRDRHDRRPGIRLRAFQAIRLPPREGGRADFRRRPVAGKYADGAQGARRQLPEGHVL